MQMLVARAVVDHRDMQPPVRGDHQRFEKLRHEVGWRNEVDIVAAFALEREHHLGQPLWPDTQPVALLAEPEILAVGAARLTAAEEDGARAAGPADGRLLATVHVPRADDDIGGGVACAPAPRRAVYRAILRADGAAAQ